MDIKHRDTFRSSGYRVNYYSAGLETNQTLHVKERDKSKGFSLVALGSLAFLEVISLTTSISQRIYPKAKGEQREPLKSQNRC